MQQDPYLVPHCSIAPLPPSLQANATEVNLLQHGISLTCIINSSHIIKYFLDLVPCSLGFTEVTAGAVQCQDSSLSNAIVEMRISNSANEKMSKYKETLKIIIFIVNVLKDNFTLPQCDIMMEIKESYRDFTVTHWLPQCVVDYNLGKFGIVMLELLFLNFLMKKMIIQKIPLVPFTKRCLFFPQTVYEEIFFSMNSNAFVLVSQRGRML